MSRVWIESVVLLAISIAGTVAAIRAGSAGFAVLFAFSGLFVAGSSLRPGSRRSFELRADLAAWLEEVSAVTGEPIEDVLDRTVSSYRAAAYAVNGD